MKHAAFYTLIRLVIALR